MVIQLAEFTARIPAIVATVVRSVPASKRSMIVVPTAGAALGICAPIATAKSRSIIRSARAITTPL